MIRAYDFIVQDSTAGGALIEDLTPTFVEFKLLDGTDVDPQPAITHKWSGIYSFDFDADAAGDARVVIDAGSALTNPGDRYIPMRLSVTAASQVSINGLSVAIASLAAAVAASAPYPINSPQSAGSIIETIRGDDHTTSSPHGPVQTWSAPAATWGDLTGATMQFTTRLAYGDQADDIELEVTHLNGLSVLNPNTADQAVRLQLTAAQTVLLTPGNQDEKLTNKWDVQVTRDDGVVFTLARGVPPVGGHTIYEDQSRAS